MNTPICDFAKKYAEKNTVRLHMPGHKGHGPLGVEGLDLTEIEGADVLYSADGIIRESMENASRLFGTERTLYSTEGSSLSIRAMIYLCLLCAKEKGASPTIVAGRNAHKTFMSAAALLDIDVEWLFPKRGDAGNISCDISPEELADKLDSMERAPVAVYLTSPDYLGNISDIAAISKVCRERGVLLAVDNAHGAYLAFLPESKHPIHLGADICCDSAHKTLPVLTGGGYLHISKDAPAELSLYAERAMSLFASTSPSYLILQSLDAANKYLATDYKKRLAEFCDRVKACRKRLCDGGIPLLGNEPLKLTVCASEMGYSGKEIEQLLLENGMVCEFCDRDYLVLMLTPEIGDEALSRLTELLESIPERSKDTMSGAPYPLAPEKAMSIREAALSPFEEIPVEISEGRILADPNVACPPAIPIIACGEVIGKAEIEMLKYYGVTTCRVVK